MLLKMYIYTCIETRGVGRKRAQRPGRESGAQRKANLGTRREGHPDDHRDRAASAGRRLITSGAQAQRG